MEYSLLFCEASYKTKPATLKRLTTSNSFRILMIRISEQRDFLLLALPNVATPNNSKWTC